MTSVETSTSLRAAWLVGSAVAVLPVPALAPAVGGGVAAALVPRTRRGDAGLGTAVGLAGGVGYLVGWAILALVLSGTFPPALPDGGSFVGFAIFVLVLDVLGGAVGAVLGGALARRTRRRNDGEAKSLEQPE